MGKKTMSGMYLIGLGLLMLIIGIVIMSLPILAPSLTLWFAWTYLGYILSGIGGLLLIVGIVLRVLRK